MKKPNQRIGADVVKSDLVELHKSTSNKSATYALHFDTVETNQFCDFTENIQNLISASNVAHGSVTISTPHTTTAIIIMKCATTVYPNITNDPKYKEKVIHHIHANNCITKCLTCMSFMCLNGFQLASMMLFHVSKTNCLILLAPST